MKEKEDSLKLFNEMKEKLLKLDPVYFSEKYLTLDGKPFRINGNGYKPFADIYRYVGVKALEQNAKPIIIVKGRQVGGTTMASALELYFMGCGLFGTNETPPIRIIHAFPQLAAAAAYTKTKLNPMIASSLTMASDKKNGRSKSYFQHLIDADTNNNGSNDSLHFKQFKGNNHIWIESTGLDADRLRGRSADIIFFDEVQDMFGQAITNSTKILSASNYGPKGSGVQVYFGTPKKKGTEFHKMWQISSQQYYHLGCEQCKKHFPLYTPGSNDWEKIWIKEYIVQCTHCGHQQDKREAAERGKWVALKPLEESDIIGFHINQLYMPHFTKERILAETPGVHPINTERVYQNEVLGEFFQGDTSPITVEEIIDKCGEPGRKFRAKIIPGEESICVLGIDYGAKADLEQIANPEKSKQGQSYSTAVILTCRAPGLLSVEFATKFKRNDIESKKGLIDQLLRQYSINLSIGDIGYSNDFSQLMHTAHGDRYLVSRAHSKVNGHVKYSQDAFPKEIVFERDFYLAELFEQLKAGQIKFPLGDYEKISWLINHCSSMEIKPSISRIGEPTIHYAKGSTPNDGLMALLNAYIAYKFIITNAFTNTNPLFAKTNIKDAQKPLMVASFIPRSFC